MTGMGTGVQITNPIIVELFHRDLLHQFVVVLLLAVLASVVVVWRTATAGTTALEPRARTILRVGFGLLWLLDGILQLQPSMPLGLGSQVLAPSIDSAPTWWHGVISTGVTLWNQHPIALAQVVVWGQIGIGLGLVASSKASSRWFGAASAVWALIIWCSTGFGGLFSLGGSLLFGWPGATLFYALAGAWLAARPETFPDVFHAVTTRALAVVLALAAVLQVLPSGNFWRVGSSNGFSDMASTMATTPQPWLLQHLVTGFGSVARAMGPGLNMLVCLWMVTTAVGLWRTPRSNANWPAYSLAAGALLGWVLVQDLGVFGGLATDPNSLLPLAVLGVAVAPRFRSAAPFTLPRISRVDFRFLQSALTATALAMAVMTVVPTGWALAHRAEITLFEATNGPVTSVQTPAPNFTLRDQHGASYSLSAHRGRVTLLTFLDPVCYQECPAIARQLASLQSSYGSKATVDLVAVAANSVRHTEGNVRHFLSSVGLNSVPHFYFLNGTLNQLRAVWEPYGIQVLPGGVGKMSIHTNVIYVIDAKSTLRFIVNDDPAEGVAGRDSTVTVLRNALAQLGIH